MERNEREPDGSSSWRTVWTVAGGTGAVTATATVYDRASRKRTVTVTAPDGTQTVSVQEDGRMASVTRQTPSQGEITKTTYGYDEHGRQSTVTDRRNGTTTYTFEGDQIQTMSTPHPGTGAQVTTFLHDNMGRVTGTVYPDQTSETRVYSKAGQVTLVFGSRTYAAGYSYDYAGRLRRMTNWSAFNPATQTGSGARTTTWNYSSTRGWLTGKRDANNSGPDYGYSAGGRLKTRQWARTGTTSRVRATYLYGFDDSTSNNEHGDRVRVTYTYDPVGTPLVNYTYDRWGRLATTSQGGGTATLTYNDANQFTGESYAGGTLGGFPWQRATTRSFSASRLPVAGSPGMVWRTRMTRQDAFGP